MTATTTLRGQSVQQQCKQLRLPAVSAQAGTLATAAEREQQPYLGYLEALLASEHPHGNAAAIRPSMS